MFKIAGLLFIALSAIIYTVERISEKIVWVAQEAATTIGNPYGTYPAYPDFSKCLNNPALWACLGIGLLLFIFGLFNKKTESEFLFVQPQMKPPVIPGNRK